MPIALVALFIAAFAFGTTEFVIAGILPHVAEGLDVSVPNAGYLVSGYALGIAVGAVITVAVSARLITVPVMRPAGADLSGAAAVLFATAVLAALVPAVLLLRRPLVALIHHDG